MQATQNGLGLVRGGLLIGTCSGQSDEDVAAGSMQATMLYNDSPPLMLWARPDKKHRIK